MGVDRDTVYRLSCVDLMYQMLTHDGELVREVKSQRPRVVVPEQALQRHLLKVRRIVAESGLGAELIERQVTREEQRLRVAPTMRGIRKDPVTLRVTPRGSHEPGHSGKFSNPTTSLGGVSMKTALKSLTLLPVLAMLGCAGGTIDLEAERTALLELDRQWAQAAAENEDVELIVSFWSDDALVIPPGQPPIVGKEALRAMVASNMEIPGFAVSWEADDMEISPDGRMAYMYGTNQFTFPDGDGNLVTSHGRALTVWRKGPDGQWKCVIDIWNAAPNPDATA